MLLALIHDPNDEVTKFARAHFVELDDEAIARHAVDADSDRQIELAVRLDDTSLHYEQRQSLIAKATSAKRPKLHSLNWVEV